jgi:hypothetical protein
MVDHLLLLLLISHCGAIAPAATGALAHVLACQQRQQGRDWANEAAADLPEGAP